MHAEPPTSWWRTLTSAIQQNDKLKSVVSRGRMLNAWIGGLFAKGLTKLTGIKDFIKNTIDEMNEAPSIKKEKELAGGILQEFVIGTLSARIRANISDKASSLLAKYKDKPNELVINFLKQDYELHGNSDVLLRDFLDFCKSKQYIRYRLEKGYYFISPLKPEKDRELLLQAGYSRERERFTQNYEIQLAPQPDQALLILNGLLRLSRENAEFQHSVRLLQIKVTFEGEKSESLPSIVINPGTGKEFAQKTLDILCKEFKDIKGLGINPLYSKKINSLIFYTQGSDEVKEDSRYAKYFEEDKVHYNPKEFAKGTYTYHLTIPADCINQPASSVPILGSIPPEDVIKDASFRRYNTFQPDEIVIVKRSSGVYNYGKILFSEGEKTSDVHYRVGLSEGVEKIMNPKNLGLGKISTQRLNRATKPKPEEASSKNLVGSTPSENVIDNASFSRNNRFQIGELVIIKQQDSGTYIYAQIFGVKSTGYIVIRDGHKQKFKPEFFGKILPQGSIKLGSTPPNDVIDAASFSSDNTFEDDELVIVWQRSPGGWDYKYGKIVYGERAGQEYRVNIAPVYAGSDIIIPTKDLGKILKNPERPKERKISKKLQFSEKNSYREIESR